MLNKNKNWVKGVRTGLQAVFGLVLFLGGILTIPEVGNFLTENNFLSIGTYGVLVAVLTYLQNVLEDYLKNE